MYDFWLSLELTKTAIVSTPRTQTTGQDEPAQGYRHTDN